jgi:hypothetical protein
MQLTIETFPKYRPNITLEQVQAYINKPSYVGEYGKFGNKDIRLVIEMARQNMKSNPTCFEVDFYNEVRKILGEDISNERIDAVKSFKQILYKEIIVCENGKHKTVKVLRKRNCK